MLPSPTENPWKTIASTFIIDANSLRPVRQRKGWAIPIRTTFRIGELQLSEAGVQLSGLGNEHLTWIKTVGWIGWGIVLIGSLTTLRTIQQGNLHSIEQFGTLLGAYLLGASIYYGARIFNARRCVPMSFTIPWGDIVELQVHPKLKWAILVYQMPFPLLDKNPQLFFLPISSLQPAMIEALADAIAHHTLNGVRRDARVFDLNLILQKVLNTFFLLSYLGMALAFFWMLFKH